MNRHTLYYNLHDALVEEGCPICRLRDQSVDRYLGHLLYQSVNDLAVRESIRRSQGFCQEHAWRMQAKGDALGIAIIHQDVVSNILRGLNRERQRATGSSSIHPLRRLLPGAVTEAARQLARKVAPRGECPACRRRDEVERAYLETLLQHYADPDLLARMRASDGLCWPHFRRALELVRDEATLHLLVDTESAHLEHVRDELAEFIRHHDYHWSERSLGPEGDSWIRAIAKVSGGQRSLP